MALSKALPGWISAERYFCISTIPTRRCCTTPPSAKSSSERAGKFPPMERRSCFERDELERDDGLFARQQRDAEQRRRTGSSTPSDRGHPLSQSASVPSAIARRQAEQGTGAGLGIEPLLLPEHHSDQGCRGDLALPRPRHPARMAAQTGGS